MVKEGEGFGAYEVIREGDEIILRIDFESLGIVPSLEDDARIMSKIIEILSETGTVTKIVLVQRRDYEYDASQAMMLLEIARIYRRLIREKLDYQTLLKTGKEHVTAQRYGTIQRIIFSLLPLDPIGAYAELTRAIRKEKIILEGTHVSSQKKDLEDYLSLLTEIATELGKTRLIVLAEPFLPGYHLGDRSVYRKIFSPSIRPDFMATKLMATYPPDGEVIDSYNVGETEITIFNVPGTSQTFYHMIPPEFKLSEDRYQLIESARNILAEFKPTRAEFVDPARMRNVFHNVGMDLLGELSDAQQLRLKEKEMENLTQILLRYTVGFGLIEILLEDEMVQDISVNSPLGRLPIFIVHGTYADCTTNIMPTASETESWAGKLRMISGRPIDEANPVLDTELILPKARSRVAVIGPPLNPYGLAYSFRRHRDKPWTMPLFIKQRMINPLGAGILSFLIDGARTMLIAGTRSAGKTSLLSAVMVDIMRRYRMISIEDTLELPTESLRNLGFNILSMKVASALTKGTTEIPADEGIRTTLRLGDSSLIVGEVRSTEAKALYEAMRVGALANVVAGTIHGDSPYGVFDRVVNDLGVPRTSFKATDIVVVANPLRSPDGLHRWRRVTQITEIRKHWEEDPLREGGFVDLMKYNPKTDELEPSADLMNGESEIIKSIAGNVKEWAGNWDVVWENILLRSSVKKLLMDTADAIKDQSLLEADFVVLANDEFHKLSDAVRGEVGAIDPKMVMNRFEEWLKRAVKRRQMQ